MHSGELICDGCGQAVDREHLARRLKRLENMTRYRPIHIHALFLSAGPPEDAEHLYSAASEFRGEGAALLKALGVATDGCSIEAALTDFQRRGYLLAHLIECPAVFANAEERERALQTRLAAAAIRIRRSLKPKKVVLVGWELDSLVTQLGDANLGSDLVLSESGRAFRLEELVRGALVTAVTAAATPSL
jgi:hypothetical protein